MVGQFTKKVRFRPFGEVNEWMIKVMVTWLSDCECALQSPNGEHVQYEIKFNESHDSLPGLVCSLVFKYIALAQMAWNGQTNYYYTITATI